MTNLVGPELEPDGRVEIIIKRLIEQLPASGDASRQRLPSERSLAALLHCSRNTLREALARLKERGVINIRPRSGAYESVPTSSPDAGMLQAAALAALQLVGPELARCAAERFSESWVERLEEITSEISRALLDRNSGAAGRAFVDFYRELAGLVDNAYFHELLARVEADGALTPEPGTIPQQRLLEAFFTQHVDVLSSLRRGEVQRSEKLSQRCIRAFAHLMHFKVRASGAGGVTP
jgi:GntR family transcriptional regulator, transcriptional repressor for pyruvate dehydrogenase complex